METFNRIVREEEGQDVVEYALVVGLVSIAAIVAMQVAGTSIDGMWRRLAARLDAILP
jgi:pilus assembly protein Flp/PilA